MLGAYTTWKSLVLYPSVDFLITNSHDLHSTIMSELLFILSLPATINRGMSMEEYKNLCTFSKCPVNESVEDVNKYVENGGLALVNRHALLVYDHFAGV